MTADIEDIVKHFPACLDFQAKQAKDRTIPYKMKGRPWESVVIDIFTINNKDYLCIVHYHSKLPVTEW